PPPKTARQGKAGRAEPASLGGWRQHESARGRHPEHGIQIDIAQPAMPRRMTPRPLRKHQRQAGCEAGRRPDDMKIERRQPPWTGCPDALFEQESRSLLAKIDPIADG